VLNNFFSENPAAAAAAAAAAGEIMWKHMVQPYRPQVTIQYGACAVQCG